MTLKLKNEYEGAVQEEEGIKTDVWMNTFCREKKRHFL